MSSLDLVERPAPGWLNEQPARTLECVMAVAGENYCISLADEREIDAPSCGEPIRGALGFDLPDGAYEVACYLPDTGAYSVWLALAGGPGARLMLPGFRHDLLVRIKRVKAQARRADILYTAGHAHTNRHAAGGQ